MIDNYELAELIRDKSLSLIDKQYELSSLNESKKLIEMNEMVEIINAMDDKGKPLYSNAEKRDIALNQILEDNDEYLDINDSILLLKKEIDKLKIEVEYHKNILQINLNTNG